MPDVKTTTASWCSEEKFKGSKCEQCAIHLELSTKTEIESASIYGLTRFLDINAKKWEKSPHQTFNNKVNYVIFIQFFNHYIYNCECFCWPYLEYML